MNLSAKRGRPQKKEEDLKRDGTYRADRHADRTMDPVPGTKVDSLREGLPEAPEWLGENGQKEWRRVVDLLDRAKILAHTDLGPVAAMCSTWEKYLQVIVDPENKPYYNIGTKRKPCWQIHPGHTVTKQLLETYVKLCAEFGFTPAARAKVPRPKEQSAASKISGMLRKAL